MLVIQLLWFELDFVNYVVNSMVVFSQCGSMSSHFYIEVFKVQNSACDIYSFLGSPSEKLKLLLGRFEMRICLAVQDASPWAWGLIIREKAGMIFILTFVSLFATCYEPMNALKTLYYFILVDKIKFNFQKKKFPVRVLQKYTRENSLCICWTFKPSQ